MHKKIAYLFAIVLSLVSIVWAAQRVAKGRQPGLLIAENAIQKWEESTPGAELGLNTEQAMGSFVLNNGGGKPVRILSLESGCGCAKPEISTDLVLPDKSARVNVKATQPSTGTRTVTITVTTDSPVTPEIKLQLHITRHRVPPYVVSVMGELVYRGKGVLLNETRLVQVITIEPKQRNKIPIISTDINFLDIGAPDIADKESKTPDIVERTYTYPITITTEPSEGEFNGEVTILDPWNGRQVQSLNVIADKPPFYKTLPSQLLVKLNSPKSANLSSFLIVAQDDSPFDVIVEGTSEASLKIDRIEQITALTHRVHLRILDLASKTPVRHDIRIQNTKLPSKFKTVPILIR